MNYMLSISFFKFYSLFLVFTFVDVNVAFSEDFKLCKSNVYRFESLNSRQENTFFMDRFYRDQLPLEVTSVVNKKLGFVKTYYEIGSTSLISEKIKLFEACSQMGITICTVDDFDEFVRRGPIDSLGVFEAVEIYSYGGEISRGPVNKHDVPEFIFFDDKALFYFSRGSGAAMLSNVRRISQDIKVKLLDFLSWKLVGCVE